MIDTGADIDTNLLPEQLQDLDLQVCYASGPQSPRTVYINHGHLTNLQALVLDSSPYVGMGSRLPSQLQQLQLDCHYRWTPVGWENLSQAMLTTHLQQLSALQITDLTIPVVGWQLFESMVTTLPDLSLSLFYTLVNPAALLVDTAPQGGTMHQLNVLHITKLKSQLGNCSVCYVAFVQYPI